MVKVSDEVPLTDLGQVDHAVWAQNLCLEHESLVLSELEATLVWLADHFPEQLVLAMELAALVAHLKLDQPSVQAALIYRAVREQTLSSQEATKLVGEESARIAQDVAGMATASLLEMSNSPLLEKEQQDQVENIKRMLVSMIRDARVAVIKLAERVIALRHAKNYTTDRRKRIAQEAKHVFAPLAGRLGIWQLKWELEDLSLRYTQESVYMEIARSLQGKRVERERQIEHMIDQVRGLLRNHGIDAAVHGRAKHIYSIWRKMQKKSVPIEQVHDVRAVRVIVDNVAQCYAALSILHTTWPHIPSEFDDYIANPKENGYRSIHTAVTAPDGQGLEIQIRTVAMHEDAELGVCAHWSYKDGEIEAPSYGAKMDWLRQVMEWHEDLGGTRSIGTLLSQQVSEDRIFVSTPKGHVLELPKGATVLDFAFRVHTDVGYATTGARVNGMPVLLNYQVETGQQVEILTAPNGSPSLDWLEPHLAIVCTDRAKAKLVAYFRSLAPSIQVELGEKALRTKLQALGLPDIDALDIAAYAQTQGMSGSQALYRALGAGELSCIGMVADLLEQGAITEQLDLPGLVELEFPQSVRFKVVSENRDGLLHDITQIIGHMALELTGTTGRVSNLASQAIITVDVTLGSWQESVRFISYLGLLEGVTEIRKEST